MKPRLLKTAVIAAALLPLTSCIRDVTPGPPDPVAGGGVRLELHTRAPLFDIPSTRTGAATEELPDAQPLWVLVFELTDKGTLYREAAVTSGSGDQRTVTLMSRPGECKLLILAGTEVAGLDSEESFDALLIREGEGVSLTEAYGLLEMPRLASPQTTVPFTPGGVIPMSGLHTVAAINEATQLGTAESRIALTRSVAKIVVENSATGFTLEGATVANAPAKGRFHNPGSTPMAADGLTDYKTTSGLASDIAAAAAGTGETLQTTAANPIYLYESPAGVTSIIVQGEYGGERGYYKLAIRRVYGGQTVGVVRNSIYRVNITAVKRPGYQTLQEAIDARDPSNQDIDWKMEVNDGYAHEIVDNGEYYLGVSNSEYILYADQSLASGHLAFVATTNAGDKSTLSVTASGDGLTATASTSGGGVYNVMVGMDDEEFVPGESGSVTVRVGNLKMNVYVRRRAAIAGALPYLEFSEPRPGADPDADPAGSGFVAAEITSGTGWLGLSPTIEDTDVETYINQTGGSIFIHPVANYGTGATPKIDGTVYLSRYDNTPDTDKNNDGKPDGGRIKMDIHQRVAEIVQPGADNTIGMAGSYVGTFHRADQTGERLLRTPIATENAGAWRAEVVDGKDFIVLDKNFPATLPENTYAESNQLPTTAKLWVEDAAANFSDREIRFRLGLTDVLPDDRPRYGRVRVSYNDHNKLYFVYVRQGEQSDWLIPTSVRSEAEGNVRFSVYNVTASNVNADGSIPQFNDKLVAPWLASGNKGVFTDYPTKAGAQFQYAPPKNGDYQYGYATYTYDFRREVYNPTSYSRKVLNDKSPASSLPSSTARWPHYNAGDYNPLYMETCPANYRRPTAGSENGEFRKSLFTTDDPIPDGASDHSNSSWGYYADGYFDRYPIGWQEASGDNRAKWAAVNPGNWNVAYAGQLFYDNRYGTNASVFFPGAGYRHHYGFLLWTGYGYYWSSSPKPEGKPVAGGMTEYSSYAFSFTAPTIYGANDAMSTGRANRPGGTLLRSTGASLRCVVCPPVALNISVNSEWLSGDRMFRFTPTATGASSYHFESSFRSSEQAEWGAWTDFPGGTADAPLHTTGNFSRFTPRATGRYRFRITVLNICGAVPWQSREYNYNYETGTLIE
jgi:hypothetical protein